MTPRDIIEKALRKTGEIGTGETPTNDEIQDGLDELNMLLDKMNQGGLSSYTESRVDISHLEGDVTSATIADINADKVDTIVSDGFLNTITTKDYTEYEAGNVIRPYGYDLFLNDKTILSIAQKEIITAPETSPDGGYDIDTIEFYDNTNTFSIVTLEDNPYREGDIIIATDNNKFTAMGTVTDDITSPTKIFLEDCTYYYQNPDVFSRYANQGAVYAYSDKTALPQEDNGYIHLTTANVADIISPRPYNIDRITDTNGTRILKQWQNEQFNQNLNGYTYYSDYPKGTIEFGSFVGASMLHYKQLNENVKLYEELNLPSGYAAALVYELARLLGIEFGTDVTAIAYEANNRMTLLKRVNHRTPMQSSGAPRGRGKFNFETGGYR